MASAAATTPVYEAGLFEATTLAAAATLIDGFEVDVGPDADSWRAGDAVLLGMVFEQGGKKTTRLLKVESQLARVGDRAYTVTLRLEGGEPVSIWVVTLATTITLYDQDGKPLSASTGEFPLDCLTRGPYLSAMDAVERLEAGLPERMSPEEARALTKEQVTEIARRSVWVFTLGPSMGRNPALSALLRGVVETPSVFSYLFGVDIQISAVGSPRRGGPVALAGVELESAVSTLRLSVNGTAALEGDLTAAPVKPPLHLCGGVTRLEAHNPARPDRRVSIRLLGARRGPAGDGDARIRPAGLIPLQLTPAD